MSLASLLHIYNLSQPSLSSNYLSGVLLTLAQLGFAILYPLGLIGSGVHNYQKLRFGLMIYFFYFLDNMNPEKLGV